MITREEWLAIVQRDETCAHPAGYTDAIDDRRALIATVRELSDALKGVVRVADGWIDFVQHNVDGWCARTVLNANEDT